MKRIKGAKALPLLLAAVMVFALLPSAAFAATGTHTLFFNVADGKFYEDSNGNEILDPGTDTEYTGQPGAWSWDGPTSTLSLDGFVWETSAPAALLIVGGNLTIDLTNGSTNTFRSTTVKPDVTSYGIYTPSTDSVIIEGGGTLNGVGGKPTGSDSMSLGIAIYDITVNNGTVNATGGSAPSTSYGLRCDTFALSGGTVNATGGAAGESIGVFNFNGGTVSGGTLTATGIAGSVYGYGIFEDSGTFTFASGTMTAIGKTNAFFDGTAAVVSAAPYVYWTNTTTSAPGGEPTLSTATPYSYSASDKYVKLTTEPFAVVANVTITGTAGTALTAGQTATITLTGETVDSGGLTGVDAASWFSSLPAGVTATADGAGSGDVITITFGGTPIAGSSAAFDITIPASALTGNADITVTANPNAKFAIAGGRSSSNDDDDDNGIVTLPLPIQPPKTGEGAGAAWLLCMAGSAAVAFVVFNKKRQSAK
ncbi:MAG: hypothetical protein LBN26_02960 [Christensenellaceae bacterium]|jgi:hypothetical protein|nr:hypothetical protein [Christensenellaceae bacterium]